MARREGIEAILKRLQGLNKHLRYQVWLGADALQKIVKHSLNNDLRP